jgi:dethiobiotin synthetase
VPEFFVTGTDTGIGKTLVSTALLAAARRRGLAVAALKPVETGCERSPGGDLLAADAALLAEAAGAPLATPTCLYKFVTPAAPAVAARLEAREISVETIRSALDALRATDPDLLLVEGAGGLLVPFTEEHTAAELARVLALPLIIVARPGLGTINHTALTVECARQRGLQVRGIIISHASPKTDDPTLLTNISEIERISHAPVLGSLPHLPSRDPQALAEAAERHLPVDSLLAPA